MLLLIGMNAGEAAGQTIFHGHIREYQEFCVFREWPVVATDSAGQPSQNWTFDVKITGLRVELQTPIRQRTKMAGQIKNCFIFDRFLISNEKYFTSPIKPIGMGSPIILCHLPRKWEIIVVN
jgi:hypothetical protein